MLSVSFSHLGFSSADRARFDGASLVEPCEYFGDAAVADEKLPRDVARPHAHQRQLHNPAAHVVRQRATVHEDAAELVDSSLAWREGLSSNIL